MICATMIHKQTDALSDSNQIKQSLLGNKYADESKQKIILSIRRGPALTFLQLYCHEFCIQQILKHGFQVIFL